MKRARATPPASARSPGLEKQRTQYQAAVEALADGQRTRLILVARAQKAALREAARTHAELAAIGLKQQFLVVNGILPKRTWRRSARRRDLRARASGVERDA